MEDSGNLWKKHCERDFKGYPLLEYESWREMYLRLFNEREEKLRKITKNISSAHSGKPKGLSSGYCILQNSVCLEDIPQNDLQKSVQARNALCRSTVY